MATVKSTSKDPSRAFVNRIAHLSDMLVQSKSGTGKTLAFSVIAMEKFNSEVSLPQTLILSPTREIAVQTADFLKAVGKYIPKFKAEVVIGGLSVQANRKDLQDCAVVVGSPGRILHLIELNVLNTKHINLLILDEVDLLTASNFNLDMIRAALPKRMQIISVSATLDMATQLQVSKFMQSPIGITPAKEVPVLKGIGQFVCRLAADEVGLEMLRKFEKLKEILSKVAFKQCFVFTNSQSLAESYKKLLAKEDWPSEVITGAYDQSQRLVVMSKLREFKIRVLLSTDLMARGIDGENVNLVINMDVPRNGMVYLHRIGRAGRFGTKGVAITLVATSEQQQQFDQIKEQFGLKSVMELPKEIDSRLIWELVDTPRVAIGDKQYDENDTLALLLDSDIKRQEDVSKLVNESTSEEEDDPMSLLLDCPGKDKEDKKHKKSTTEQLNILQEFDQFTESEIVPPEEEAADNVSLENHADDVSVAASSIPAVKNQNQSPQIKLKDKRNTVSVGVADLSNWQDMFNAQYAMINEYVQRNRTVVQV